VDLSPESLSRRVNFGRGKGVRRKPFGLVGESWGGLGEGAQRECEVIKGRVGHGDVGIRQSPLV
jgi:hypothetical protein